LNTCQGTREESYSVKIRLNALYNEDFDGKFHDYSEWNKSIHTFSQHWGQIQPYWVRLEGSYKFGFIVPDLGAGANISRSIKDVDFKVSVKLAP